MPALVHHFLKVYPLRARPQICTAHAGVHLTSLSTPRIHIRKQLVLSAAGTRHAAALSEIPGNTGVNSDSAPHNRAKPSEPLLTLDESKRIALARGLVLQVQTWGPVYNLTCRDGSADGKLVAQSSGFTASPFGLMHCDSLRVFTRELQPQDGQSSAQRGIGLGLFMCGAVIALGLEAGCPKAEILAINDDDVIHRRLCRYYRRMGFETVAEVGNKGLRDMPHLLVWGGPGTRMNVDTSTFLKKWSRSIRLRR